MTAELHKQTDRAPLRTYRLNCAGRTMRKVRWMKWHCPPDTGFEIRTLAIWGRARYLSVTGAPHNVDSLRVSREETFCFFETWMPKRGSFDQQAGSFNPLTAKLFNLNFHPLEVVSRWRDPQLQVSEHYSDLTKRRSTLFKSCWLMSHFILNIFKIWYLMY